jgi:hypothetical protein
MTQYHMIWYEYRVGFHHDDDDDDDDETLRLILFVPVRQDHLIICSYTAEDMMIYHDDRSHGPNTESLRYGMIVA